jgi:hypothetical protein
MKIELDKMEWEKWGEKDILDIKNIVKSEIKKYISYYKKLKLNEGLDFKKIFIFNEVFSGEINALVSPIGIMEYIHVDEKIREIARKEQIVIDKDFNKLAYNESVYKVFKYYFDKNFKKEKKNKLQQLQLQLRLRVILIKLLNKKLMFLGIGLH